LIEVFKVVENSELMFSCITELNYVFTPWQNADLGRNCDIEYISILPGTDHGIMSVNFRADRFKRTRLHPLRIDWLICGPVTIVNIRNPKEAQDVDVFTVNILSA